MTAIICEKNVKKREKKKYVEFIIIKKNQIKPTDCNGNGIN